MTALWHVQPHFRSVKEAFSKPGSLQKCTSHDERIGVFPKITHKKQHVIKTTASKLRLRQSFPVPFFFLSRSIPIHAFVCSPCRFRPRPACAQLFRQEQAAATGIIFSLMTARMRNVLFPCGARPPRPPFPSRPCTFLTTDNPAAKKPGSFPHDSTLCSASRLRSGDFSRFKTGILAETSGGIPCTTQTKPDCPDIPFPGIPVLRASLSAHRTLRSNDADGRSPELPLPTGSTAPAPRPDQPPAAQAPAKQRTSISGVPPPWEKHTDTSAYPARIRTKAASTWPCRNGIFPKSTSSSTRCRARTFSAVSYTHLRAHETD